MPRPWTQHQRASVAILVAILAIIHWWGKADRGGFFGSFTPEGPIVITISDRTYRFPETYLRMYTPASEEYEPGALLRVAMPSFAPWLTLTEAEQARTDWASVSVSGSNVPGSLERTLRSYEGPKTFARPREYHPGATAQSTFRYDVYYAMKNGEIDFTLECNTDVVPFPRCTLHYLFADSRIASSFSRAYIDEVPEIRERINALLLSFRQ